MKRLTTEKTAQATLTRNADDLLSELQAIRVDLKRRFRLRDRVIDGLLAGMVANQPCFLIGSRGTAKTALVKAVASYLAQARFIHFGMHKATTVEDLFGGPDIVALQQGKFQRDTEGRIPQADVVLFDEGIKASEATLQSTLVPLESRTFEGQELPLVLAVLASNELPYEVRGQVNGKVLPSRPGEDSLMPFMDRFTFRFVVEELEVGSDNWREVVFRGVTRQKDDSLCLSVEEVRFLQNSLDSLVTFSPELEDLMTDVAILLKLGVPTKGNAKVDVSSRTWIKVVQSLKAIALVQGRAQVNATDLQWLSDILWTTPDQRQVILEATMLVGPAIVRECHAMMQQVADLRELAETNRLVLNTTVPEGISAAPSGVAVTPSNSLGVTEKLLHLIRQNREELGQMNPATPEEEGAVKDAETYLDFSKVQVLKLLQDRMSGKWSNKATAKA